MDPFANGPIFDTSATFYIPLYSFFSESPQFFLNTKNLCEDLQIVMKTNSFLDMAIANQLTSMGMVLDLGFFELNDNIYYGPKISEKLIYGIEIASPIAIPQGSVYQTFKMISNETVFAIHFFLYNKVLAQYWDIEQYDISLDGHTLTTVDTNSDYQLYNPSRSNIDILKTYVVGLKLDRKSTFVSIVKCMTAVRTKHVNNSFLTRPHTLTFQKVQFARNNAIRNL